MLVIDENMFKLAKMQETLLKVSKDNREENLNNYKKTVVEIDTKAFSDILEEINHIDEHNQSLEDELQFLIGIRNTYEQLLELQLNFKRICEIYGGIQLSLSDLSSLNIEYIDKRINAINGYLMNIKNIEANKEQLQKLNDQLIEEEKKKVALENKLLEFDNALRKNFGSVEGRCIVNGGLQYTSVSLEYEKIGIDFERLLDNADLFETVLAEAESEKDDISEKVRVAEVCYNNTLTAESKEILNEIKNDFLRIKYKVAMLKIIGLLSKNSDSYKSFVDKRKDILDLIKYRLSCMENLGLKNSIDPFSRTKVKEQLDVVLSLTDNSKTINSLRKEISQLNSWTEEMLNQNNSYLVTLNDTRSLIERNVGFGDIDIAPVVSFDELVSKKEIKDNQVVKVRSIPVDMNMNIVNQKTASVIKRVNQMMNDNEVVDSIEHKSEIVPELVIVPTTPVIDLNDRKIEEPMLTVDPIVSVPEEPFLGNINDSLEKVPEFLETEDDLPVEEIEEDSENDEFAPMWDEELLQPDVNSDIFETVTPFDEPLFFNDRSDESVSTENIVPLNLASVKNEDEKVEETLLGLNNDFEEMPDVFWTTQDEHEKSEEDTEVSNVELSFDEQIDALLSMENSNDTSKTKKRVA